MRSLPLYFHAAAAAENPLRFWMIPAPAAPARPGNMQGEGAAAPVPLHPLPHQGSFWRRQPMTALAKETPLQLT